MNETHIETILKTEQVYVDAAKDMADLGNLEQTGEKLSHAEKFQDDVIYCVLCDYTKPAEQESVQVEFLKKMLNVANNDYVKNAQKIYSDGKTYCIKKLGEKL
jgi:predicted nucleic-acid-binding Zn-ribbon protein